MMATPAVESDPDYVMSSQDGEDTEGDDDLTSAHSSILEDPSFQFDADELFNSVISEETRQQASRITDNGMADMSADGEGCPASNAQALALAALDALNSSARAARRGGRNLTDVSLGAARSCDACGATVANLRMRHKQGCPRKSGGPYLCRFKGCQKEFSTNPERCKHEEKSHEKKQGKPRDQLRKGRFLERNGKMLCRFVNCSLEFENAADRVRHEQFGHDAEVFVCREPNCDKIYQSELALQKHFQVEHVQKSERIYVCRYGDCGKQFKYTCSRRYHEQNSHEMTPEEKQKRYPCLYPNCPSSFTLAKSRIIHERSVHEASWEALPAFKGSGRATERRKQAEADFITDFTVMKVMERMFQDPNNPDFSVADDVIGPGGILIKQERTPRSASVVPRATRRSSLDCRELACRRPDCGLIFVGAQLRDLHEQEMHGGKIFLCHLGCDKSYGNQQSLREHITAAHMPGYIEGVFECRFEGCGKRFKYKCSRRAHERTLHSVAPEERVRFPCTYPGCTHSFLYKNSRALHERRAHTEQREAEKQGVKLEPQASKDEKKRDVCQACGANVKDWVQHRQGYCKTKLAEIAQGNRFPCKFGCGKVYRSQASTKSHERKVHILGKGMYKCRFGCWKFYYYLEYLKAHERRCHNVRFATSSKSEKRRQAQAKKRKVEAPPPNYDGTGPPFWCRFGCSRKWPMEKSRDHHEKLAHMEIFKQFVCSFGCGRRYMVKRSCQAHEKLVHLGLKPEHSCLVCGRTYQSAARLRLHTITTHESRHTARPRHACRYGCGKNFSVISLRTLHEKCAHEPFLSSAQTKDNLSESGDKVDGSKNNIGQTASVSNSTNSSRRKANSNRRKNKPRRCKDSPKKIKDNNPKPSDSFDRILQPFLKAAQEQAEHNDIGLNCSDNLNRVIKDEAMQNAEYSE